MRLNFAKDSRAPISGTSVSTTQAKPFEQGATRPVTASISALEGTHEQVLVLVANGSPDPCAQNDS